MKQTRTVLLLNILLMLYSLGGICSKLAAREQVFSLKFCIYYGIILFLLGIYAIGWQQIIKRLPLTTAFANKAITIVWGIVWGGVFFHESVTCGKVFGALFVICGIVLYAWSGKEGDKGDE